MLSVHVIFKRVSQANHSFGYRSHAGTRTLVRNAAECVFCHIFLWLYNKVVVFEILIKIYFV